MPYFCSFLVLVAPDPDRETEQAALQDSCRLVPLSSANLHQTDRAANHLLLEAQGGCEELSLALCPATQWNTSL